MMAALAGWRVYLPTPLPEQSRSVPLKLKLLLNARIADRLLPRWSERAAVLGFYRSRHYTPVWIDDGKLHARGSSAIQFLAQVGLEGLDPGDYQTAPLSFISDGALARSELELTAAILRYARDVQFGRISGGDFERMIQFERPRFDARKLLDELAGMTDVDSALNLLAPPSVEYRALRAKLAELRASPAGANDLASRSGKMRTVIDNMERWRWYPRDLGATNVVVNIPRYRLTFTQEGVVKFIGRTVVGERALPTPLLSASMTSLTLNPIWNMPDQMVEREILPRLKQDPDLLDRLGLKTERRVDGTLRLYQAPGDGNAEGRVRFNFPNKFLVYQHDTPDRRLFDQDARAYSHGCVRVENAIYYAGFLLASAYPGEQYPPERLFSLFGPNEIEFRFPKPIPVHLTYQTAYVDSDGSLVLLPDIYGLDAKVEAALDARSKVSRLTQVVGRI
ncbi:L,D-transpeptidase family protein [Bradyrhizobium sp. INPA01-394B]|uniref:L,D-transpeptidase family protein n=2 Tax=Bradyrhizobium campsiandrae TaxID=1729892 RepID=A0ABR7UIE7_9BRAD|nr:L,D-transpeptidase family protein [Bradyrhizobium campsiandrae]MBC9983710.1 L,D-transpeptidase family protein [Bradyrhizobium campsiandrae]